MAITSEAGPSASWMAWTVSRVVLPMRSRAGRSVAPSSVTRTYTGSRASPVITIASHPVRFMVAGNRPPKVESKKSPVSGDFDATQARLFPGTVVSVTGPTENTTTLSGSNAIHARGHMIQQKAHGEAVAAEQRPRLRLRSPARRESRPCPHRRRGSARHSHSSGEMITDPADPSPSAAGRGAGGRASGECCTEQAPPAPRPRARLRWVRTQAATLNSRRAT